MRYRELGRTGLKVSILSQGGAAFGQQFGVVSQAEVTECVRAAIDAGINLFDTSAYYGKGLAEEMLGNALAGELREKVLICTKAGRLDASEFDFTPAGMQRCFEASLRRLKTDHVDILLAHDIEFATDFEAVFTDTADCLHKLKRQGKCRFIGMSCHPLGLLRKVIERCNVDVVISYTALQLAEASGCWDELLPAGAEQHGVGVLNGSPLCIGALTNPGPPLWHPGSANLKAVIRKAVEHCQARGADISMLGMQFCFAEERIASIITGTARARLNWRSNLKAARPRRLDARRSSPGSAGHFGARAQRNLAVRELASESAGGKTATRTRRVVRPVACPRFFCAEAYNVQSKTTPAAPLRILNTCRLRSIRLKEVKPLRDAAAACKFGGGVETSTRYLRLRRSPSASERRTSRHKPSQIGPAPEPAQQVRTRTRSARTLKSASGFAGARQQRVRQRYSSTSRLLKHAGTNFEHMIRYWQRRDSAVMQDVAIAPQSARRSERAGSDLHPARAAIFAGKTTARWLHSR